MNIQACAELVQRGDPDRFLATMSAPPEARGVLFVLFAFNLELARAAGASKEALIAEMRLQYWHDLLTAAGSGPLPAHEVGGPLVDLIREGNLDRAPLLAAVAARRNDIYAEGFTDSAQLLTYLDKATVGILWVAAQALGEDTAHETAFRRAAMAGALANYLLSRPSLVAQGIPVPAPEILRDLALQAMKDWQSARATRFGAAKPVLRSLWQSPHVLRRASADPAQVTGLGTSEFAKRGKLLWLGLTNRW